MMETGNSNHGFVVTKRILSMILVFLISSFVRAANVYVSEGHYRSK